MPSGMFDRWTCRPLSDALRARSPTRGRPLRGLREVSQTTNLVEPRRSIAQVSWCYAEVSLNEASKADHPGYSR